MGKINLLSPQVANLIAAGEVVDRPASAVKELLENAIDSGASQITVEIQRGGVTFIRVADNGCGIEKDDLAPAITRHSTSKIKDAADLNSIFTLGFRGEALAAIASVSKLRIFSKTEASDMGALLESEGGHIISLSDTGCREGTTVIVEELFYNVPARRKFLKKDSTEAIAIGAVVEKIALSKPEISFKYISDGEIKFMTSGKGDLNETIWALFGRDIAKRALKTDREEGGIRVHGYVSEPDLHRSNRSMENFFINGRYIKSKTAAAALEQAYSSKIPQDRFPFCVLNIELNPAAVDVNVHPAKLEVKFANEKLIFDAVYYAVLTALEAAAKRPELMLAKNQQKSNTPQSMANPFGENTPAESEFTEKKSPARSSVYSGAFIPQDKRKPKSEQLRLSDAGITSGISKKPSPQRSPQAIREETMSAEEAARANREAYENIKKASAYVPSYIPREDELPPLVKELEEVQMKSADAAMSRLKPADSSVEKPVESRTEAAVVPEITEKISENSSVKDLDLPDVIEIHAEDIPEYFILGEAFNCYVLVQVADRLLMIDKHAAHERILFDELCRKMHAALFSNNRGGQMLLTSYDVDLLSSEVDALGDYDTQIHALGFDYTLKKVGVSSYKAQITQIPEDLDSASAAELFTTLATNLSDMTASVESAADKFFENRLWQASCKAAIKGGRVYDIAHIKWICDRLLKKPGADNQVIRTCPHGRPVAFEIKKSSIDRQFARLG